MLTRPTRPTRPAPSENATDLVAPDEGAPVLLGEAAPEDDEPECDAPDEWAVEEAPAALEEATETEVCACKICCQSHAQCKGSTLLRRLTTGMVEATEPESSTRKRQRQHASNDRKSEQREKGLPVGDPTSTVKKDAATSSRPVDWTYDWTL